MPTPSEQYTPALKRFSNYLTGFNAFFNETWLNSVTCVFV